MERIICNGEVLEVMKKKKEIEKKIKWNKKNFIEKNRIQLKMSKKWMKWQAKSFIYFFKNNMKKRILKRRNKKNKKCGKRII